MLLKISLCMLGVRRDSERELLDTHHILILPSNLLTQYTGESLRFAWLAHSFCFFFLNYHYHQCYSCCSALSSCVVSLSLLAAVPLHRKQQISGSVWPFLSLKSSQEQVASCLASHQTFQCWAPAGSVSAVVAAAAPSVVSLFQTPQAALGS